MEQEKTTHDLRFNALHVLVLFLICVCKAQAQPGWRDHTLRYAYLILDKKGNEIAFRKDKRYTIMIDNVLYRGSGIPQDSLKPLKRNHEDPTIQIRINDFALALSRKANKAQHQQLQIKIIHRKDTMYICQPTGTGSFQSTSRKQKAAEQPPDLSLQFVAGHYFFPAWAKHLLRHSLKSSGSVTIANLDQHHFIIPESTYKAFSMAKGHKEEQQNYNTAEALIVANFMKDHFSFSRTTEATTFDRPLQPFSKPRWSNWRQSYYPTQQKDEYVGIVEMSFDTLNWSGGRGIFVRYNKINNGMTTWSPTQAIRYSSTATLSKDEFNGFYYNKSFIRDTTCKELFYATYMYPKWYCSADEGKTWVPHPMLSWLYTVHEFRQLEFLDQHHALIFKLTKVRPKNKSYDIQQGTYYLLKDFLIVDSLKTPDDKHFNDNYNGYDFRIENDTVFLGSWTYSEYAETGKARFRPFLTKDNSHWKFGIAEKTVTRTSQKRPTGSIVYQNFTIANDSQLVFGDLGSLTLHDNLTELHKKGLILENGRYICISGLENGTLLSFDGGKQWFVYPLTLEKNGRYDFLEMDKDGIITYLTNTWEYNGNRFNKVFIKFTALGKQ